MDNNFRQIKPGFAQSSVDYSRREQALSACDYLGKIHLLDSFFFDNQTPLKGIEQETQCIQKEDKDFLAGLVPKTFVNRYLLVRKFTNYTNCAIKLALNNFRYFGFRRGIK